MQCKRHLFWACRYRDPKRLNDRLQDRAGERSSAHFVSMQIGSALTKTGRTILRNSHNFIAAQWPTPPFVPRNARSAE